MLTPHFIVIVAYIDEDVMTINYDRINLISRFSHTLYNGMPASMQRVMIIFMF